MPEAAGLGDQVLGVVVVGGEDVRHAFGDADAALLEAVQLFRIVGEQAHGGEAQLAQHLGGGLIDALIGAEEIGRAHV